MKATLEFHLPQDTLEYRVAQSGMAYKCALSEIYEQIRQRLKHGHQFETADDALEWCKGLVHDCWKDAEDPDRWQ